jgi:DNA polymerase III alpha subunit
MHVNDYGEVVLTEPDLFQMLYEGRDLAATVVEIDPLIERYNELCLTNDKPTAVFASSVLQGSPQAYHMERQSRWLFPAAYNDLDVWAVLRDRCQSDEELARLLVEQQEYETRGLTPLLRLMIYLVDSFRARKIVWGVGRGSSVASFALFLIGITKINPILYGLEIGEFLKD